MQCAIVLESIILGIGDPVKQTSPLDLSRDVFETNVG